MDTPYEGIFDSLHLKIFNLMSQFKKVPIFLSQDMDMKMGTKRIIFISNSILYAIKLVSSFMSFYRTTAISRDCLKPVPNL